MVNRRANSVVMNAGQKYFALLAVIRVQRRYKKYDPCWDSQRSQHSGHIHGGRSAASVHAVVKHRSTEDFLVEHGLVGPVRCRLLTVEILAQRWKDLGLTVGVV